MPAFGSIQILIGALFLAFTVGVVAVLVWMARQASKPAVPYAEVAKPGYRLRGYWFRLVLLAAIASVVASLFFLPYPSTAQLARAQTVRVIGRQFSWQLSTTRFRVGQTVDFAVTAADVNHGFGLYDPQGVLIAQTQPMPGYTNHLVVTFSKPGTYIVRCMEYCGLVHHYMEITFVVTGRAR